MRLDGSDDPGVTSIIISTVCIAAVVVSTACDHEEMDVPAQARCAVPVRRSGGPCPVDCNLEPFPPGVAVRIADQGNTVSSLECSVARDGHVYCYNPVWGPMLRSVCRGFSRVSAGLDHACALHACGAAVCWGSDGMGQLRRESAARNAFDAVISQQGGYVDLVTAGEYHTCISSGADVQCWGGGLTGDVRGSTRIALRSAPCDLKSGGRFSCALMADGRVSCWGAGNPLASQATTPPAGRSITAGMRGDKITVGPSSLCIWVEGGARCWGRAVWDRDDPDDLLDGVRVPEFAEAADVAIGSDRACVLYSDSRLSCLGAGRSGACDSDRVCDALNLVDSPAVGVRVAGTRTEILHRNGLVTCVGGECGDGRAWY